MYSRLIIFFLLFVLFVSNVFSNDSTHIEKRKKIIIGVSAGLAYSGSLVYLNQIWYKPYNTGHFHFFDDNDEWYAMDKAGHAFTVYYASVYLNKLFQYAGYKRSAYYAAGIAWLYLLNIEIFDGFSTGWGFSWGDFTANTIGTSLFFLNKTVCKNFFIPKFSYYSTSYPSLNPMLLGQNNAERIIKDYNGQTYWLSISPFFNWKRNIEWLCVSFGYGIDGLIGARSNVYYRNNTFYDYSYIQRNKQFYLSLDIDLSKIPVRAKWLKKILESINWIKLPAPAIEWKGNNVYFRPLLFSN